MSATFMNKKPKEMTDAAWTVLIEAWENGLSDREASFRIEKLTGEEISAEAIRQMCKDYPEVGELRANLLSDLLSSAKLTIAETLRDKDSKENVKTARWYLERKAADEFSTKQAVAFEGAVIELSLEEKEKKLKELVEEFDPNGE